MVHDYFRLTFRSNPISGKRISLYCLNYGLIYYFFKRAFDKGLNPLLGIVSLDTSEAVNKRGLVYDQNAEEMFYKVFGHETL